MTDLELAFTPALDLARMIATRAVSPVEVVSNALARIDDVNPTLNCFCFVWHDEAVKAAHLAAQAVARGETLGTLHGVPIALKDTTPTAGHRTTLGSYTHEHWIPDRDAYIVGALRRAGAIIVGKTTTPEFAHTLLTDSPLWGVTRNPWNLERTPGGSSGGSAAAVAGGLVPLATASDGGGSVRIPASYTGCFGMKPTFGRVPRGPFEFRDWIDTVSYGPLTRSVTDAVVGQDPYDSDSLPHPGYSYVDRLGAAPPALRIAYSPTLGYARVAADVRRIVDAAVAALGELLHVAIERIPDRFTDAGYAW